MPIGRGFPNIELNLEKYMEYNQDFLDRITAEDTCNFLEDVHGWNNHRPLLYLALKLSGHGNILELGCGDGSTNHLNCYGKESGRNVNSYDYDQKWLNKYLPLLSIIEPKHEFFTTQNPTVLSNAIDYYTLDTTTTVCLVDHSPGERRWEDARDIADRVDFVVIHDSELAATGYLMDRIWGLYKYRLNINSEGACAALVSNTLDVGVFDGMHLGRFLLEKRIA